MLLKLSGTIYEMVRIVLCTHIPFLVKHLPLDWGSYDPQDLSWLCLYLKITVRDAHGATLKAI